MFAVKYLSSTCVIFLFVIFSLSQVQAQSASSPYQVKIDSLQSLIKQQPKDDTTKVKRLNYLARICFFDMQFQRGLLTTLEARRLAKKLHYAKGEALYWRTLETFSGGPLDYYYYNFLAKWFYADRKQREEIVQLGVGYPAKWDEEKAKTQLLIALNYFEKHPDPDREILANLLFLYVGYNKREEQAPYISKTISEFRKNKQTTPLFFTLALNMVFLEREGKLKESKEAEIEARSIIANTKNEREVALMKHYLSFRYASLGRTNASYELLHQVDQLLEKIGEKELRVEVLSRLSQVCFGLPLYKKAIDYYKKQVLDTIRKLKIDNSKTKFQNSFGFVQKQEKRT